MPLEICAELDRDVAVYLAGETIVIKVTVENVASRGRAKEQLAWGSVQLTCERTTGTATTSSRERPTTAIARSAATVFSSLPVIIFCDVQLSPGEKREFNCEIPMSRNGLPPTFRGQLVRYVNRIAVAVQQLQAPIRLSYLPVRIIPAVGLESKLSVPCNPFLAESMKRATVAEVVTAAVDEMTMPRRSQAFALTNGNSRVALLTLSKKAFRMGEDVCGHLDFADSDSPCVQYSVGLETEESLVENSTVEAAQKSCRTHSTTVSQTVCVCAFSPNSTFRLNVPLNAPASFTTDTVQLKWKLRFVFVVTAKAYEIRCSSGNTQSAAPVDVPIESFSWTTDVAVLPCSPQNAALLDSSFCSKVSLLV
ncbi:unnamed protein product [Caenorhabditis auriculariae]|uniref:Uncharacterized protein n=1 Tax=Caenorhabditis auriculariae TaxID=2777116 RepID=A0A8S1GXG0_9PELO|nr:unnamed protein product [Caenorhabditis auriculariae]